MAFVTPTDVTVGSVLTASKYNQEVVDNTLDLRSRDGLIYITSQTISGTTLTLDNVFTTNFFAYRIHIHAVRGLGWVSAVMRSSAPADVGGSNYDQTLIQTNTGTTPTRVTANAQTSWANVFLAGDRGGFMTMEIMNPAQTDYTQAVVNAFASENADAFKANHSVGGYGFRNTTAHAGIKFTFAGAATGVARVYAYGEG
jgi:hypothetical protein